MMGGTLPDVLRPMGLIAAEHRYRSGRSPCMCELILC